LRKALGQTIEETRISEQIDPKVSWNFGETFRKQADLRAKRSKPKEDPRKKRQVFLNGVSNKERV
jgi:hypothetical protein